MRDGSVVSIIFLFEEDMDAARREAQFGCCWDRFWLTLANGGDKQHPVDAAAVYLKLAETAIRMQNGRYEDAVELLTKAAPAMKRIGKSADFVWALEAVRSNYKIKRNFIKLLEENRNLLYLS